MELSFLKRFKQKSIKDYKVLELESNNVRLHFELVETLKARIKDLERENHLLRELLGKNQESEIDAGSHMIAPSSHPPKAKRKIRSYGELRGLLEEESKKRLSLGKEIEDEDVVVGS